MRMKANQMSKIKDRLYVARAKARKALPIMSHGYEELILKTLKRSDVLIIPGATGSGKSTQTPQMIVDTATATGVGGFVNVISTQPRRISATSLARRVAFERCEQLGDSVGYHVRFGLARPCLGGSITFCTTGMLWQYLSDRDLFLDTYSHVIIDEVHERSAEMDLLLLTMRNAMYSRTNRKCPKLILMSATMDTGLFRDYFRTAPNGLSPLRAEVVEVPGRLYPIESFYLEDFIPSMESGANTSSHLKDGDTTTYLKKQIMAHDPSLISNSSTGNSSTAVSATSSASDPDEDVEPVLEDISFRSIVPIQLVTAAIIHVLDTHESGDILVFLPGMGDIDGIAKTLSPLPLFGVGAHRNVKVFRLHAELSDTNDEVFDKLPPGWRRLILATEIAESAITLPEVKHVIDTGTAKTLVHNRDNGSRALGTIWVDQKSQQQRRGRAGRTSPGNYFALYTKTKGESFVTAHEPELVTTDLTSLVLSLKSSNHFDDVRQSLSLTLDPPPVRHVDDAISELRRLGALSSDESITPLGRVLSHIPMHPGAAKVILLGVIFHCLEPMLIAAASLDMTLLRKVGENARAQNNLRRRFGGNSESDLISNINAFREYAEGDEVDKTLFNSHGMREVARTVRSMCELLIRLGIVPEFEVGDGLMPQLPPELNTNAQSAPLIKALLGLTIESETAVRSSDYSWLGRQGALLPDPHGTTRFLGNGKLFNDEHGGRAPMRGDLIHYSYGMKSSGNVIAMKSTSMATPLSAVLTAHSAVMLQEDARVIIDDVINMKLDTPHHGGRGTDPQRMTLLYEYRKAIERFQQLAWSTLDRNQTKLGQSNPTSEEGSSGSMFNGDRALRDAFAKSLAHILEVDDQAEQLLLRDRLETRFQDHKAKRRLQDHQFEERQEMRRLKAVTEKELVENEYGDEYDEHDEHEEEQEERGKEWKPFD